MRSRSSSESPFPRGATGAGSGDGGVADRLFGPAVRFWQGVFGSHTQAVMIGIGGFVALGLAAVVGGTVLSLWRRGREEDF